MATVNKDFKIKSGLVVEGSSATVGGFNVLTKKQDDQDYIVGLIGGTATSANTANKVVKRDADGNFAAGTITAAVTGNVTGDVTGNVTGNLTGNVTGNVTGTVSSLSNHDTADLAEGTNLYFTEERAQDAVGNALGTGLSYNDSTGAVSVTANTYDAYGAAAAAKTAAEATASADATSKANAAQSAAEATASADATSKANAAVSTASADATSKANAAQSAAEATAASALTAAISTEVSSRNSAIASAISTEVGDRNTAITNAVAAVVDAAPAALDTLNELAAALADSPDTVSNLTTLVGTKAPLASPALTGVPTAPTAAADTSTTQIATTAFAKAEADAAQSAAEATASADATSKANAAVSTASADATSKANAAQSAAEATASADATSKANAAVSTAAADATSKANAAQAAAISAAAADATSKANAALTSAQTYADALTTSDVAEGTAQYFTDARAKTSAADLLTGATKTNITITGSGSGLVITAENGVADSTTTDLAEGTNLYFTNARAVTALEAVVPDFTAVEINSVAKQVAATLSAPTAGVQTAHAFAKADYRSAEYLVKVANGNHTEISKVLLTLDSTDGIAITEYGIVGTNGSLATVSAGISGANVQLLVTTANNTSTVTVVGTLLA